MKITPLTKSCVRASSTLSVNAKPRTSKKCERHAYKYLLETQPDHGKKQIPVCMPKTSPMKTLSEETPQQFTH